MNSLCQEKCLVSKSAIIGNYSKIGRAYSTRHSRHRVGAKGPCSSRGLSMVVESKGVRFVKEKQGSKEVRFI
jgi:hypothetical protein